jgi:pilus assembly protein CpaB
MRSGRPFIIIGGVLFLVALAVGAIWLISNRASSSPAGDVEGTPQPTEVPNMREIVVAAQRVIPRGTRITAENNAVKSVDWPEESVPEGALTNIEDAYGRIARVDIVLNMPVTEDMLTEDAGDLSTVGSDAALQIPSGKVAYALPIGRWSGVAWALQPGDHVDVLISVLVVDVDEDYQTVLPSTKVVCSGYELVEGAVRMGCTGVPIGRVELLPNGIMEIEGPTGEQRSRLVTQLTVQDAIVLHVGDWPLPGAEAPPPETKDEEPVEEEKTAAPPPREDVESLTLIVTLQDAMVLKFAEEAGASMDLVLRSASDADKLIGTESVTLQYVFERFEIEVPPKLPYGVTPTVPRLRPGTVGESVPLSVEGGRTARPGEERAR